MIKELNDETTMNLLRDGMINELQAKLAALKAEAAANYKYPDHFHNIYSAEEIWDEIIPNDYATYKAMNNFEFELNESPYVEVIDRDRLANDNFLMDEFDYINERYRDFDDLYYLVDTDHLIVEYKACCDEYISLILEDDYNALINYSIKNDIIHMILNHHDIPEYQNILIDAINAMSRNKVKELVKFITSVDYDGFHIAATDTISEFILYNDEAQLNLFNELKDEIYDDNQRIIQREIDNYNEMHNCKLEELVNDEFDRYMSGEINMHEYETFKMIVEMAKR